MTIDIQPEWWKSKGSFQVPFGSSHGDLMAPNVMLRLSDGRYGQIVIHDIHSGTNTPTTAYFIGSELLNNPSQEKQ